MYNIPVTVDGTTFWMSLSQNQLRKIRRTRGQARIHVDIGVGD